MCPRPTIDELTILSGTDSPEYAFELLLSNPTNLPVFINKLTIVSFERKDVMYFTPPPMFTYNLSIAGVDISKEGFSELNGKEPPGRPDLANSEAGSPITGKYVNAAYSCSIEVSFPINLELPGSQKGLLRFVMSDKLILKQKTLGSGLDLDALDAGLNTIFDEAPLVKYRPDEKQKLHLYGGSLLMVSIGSGAPIAGKLKHPFLFDRVTF